MTVDQVADATRVRATLLRAMEDDDFSLCGGDVYARGHLRSVAATLRVDPQPWLDAFSAQVPPAVPPPRKRGGPPAAAGFSRPTPAGAVESLESAADDQTAVMARLSTKSPRVRRGPNWTLAMVVALLAIGVVVVVSLVQRVRTPADAAPPVASLSPTPAPATTASSAPSTPPTSSPPATPSSSAPGAGTTVVVRVTGPRSWVAVGPVRGGKPLFEGVLAEGQTRTFTAAGRLRVVVGDAGAVALTVNGEELGTPGRRGVVARLEFGPAPVASA